MTRDEGYALLAPYIASIGIRSVREFVVAALAQGPESFWVVPASSTGKNHPEDELGQGGLVIHTAKACRYALDLLRRDAQEFYGEGERRDIIIAGCVLQDLYRSGLPGRELYDGDRLRTDPLHMAYVRFALKDIVLTVDIHDDSDGGPELPASRYPWFNDLMVAIEGHYGPWSPMPQLQLPKDDWRNLVFEADYAVSRKCVMVAPEAPENIAEYIGLN